MTKLEEVARAICEADNHAWPEDDYNGRFQRRAFLKQARAAIAAMREPTEAMLMAAREYGGAFTSNVKQDCEPYLEAWQEMVDEALKP